MFPYTLLSHINWRTIQETMKMMIDNLLCCTLIIFTLYGRIADHQGGQVDFNLMAIPVLVNTF